MEVMMVGTMQDRKPGEQVKGHTPESCHPQNELFHDKNIIKF